MIFIPYAFADWTLLEQSGNWVICNRNEWQTPAQTGNGIAKWKTTISGFSGYYAKIMFTDLTTWREWWEVHTEFMGVLYWNFSGSNTNIVVKMWFKDWYAMFGTGYGRYVKANALINETNWESGDFETTFHEYTLGKNVEVYASFDNSTGTFSIYFLNYDPRYSTPTKWTPKTWENVTLPSNWGQSVTIEFWVEYRGKGYMHGYIADEFVSRSVPYGEYRAENIWEFIGRLISNAVPAWLINFIWSLGSWFQNLFVVLGVVWNCATTFIQYIPFILLCWILDAACTSIIKGDLHPLGVVFTTIFDVGRGIIQTLVNIAHAIYDFITFWS